MKRRYRAVAAMVGAFALMLSVSAVTATDARLLECGADEFNNQVEATFELSQAREIWEHLPAMKVAPELEESLEPVFVALFAGSYTTITADGPSEVVNAVCVIGGSGFKVIYTDVDRTGFVG